MNPFAGSTVAALLLCAACSERAAVTSSQAPPRDGPAPIASSEKPMPRGAPAERATSEAKDHDTTGSRQQKKSAR